MIAIPNMSKPKSCYNHCFEDFIANKEIGCPLNDYIESHQYKNKIHPDCPLIEIDQETIDIAQDIMDGCKRFKERRADEYNTERD